jgi:hypothetical protein
LGITGIRGKLINAGNLFHPCSPSILQRVTSMVGAFEVIAIAASGPADCVNPLWVERVNRERAAITAQLAHPAHTAAEFHDSGILGATISRVRVGRVQGNSHKLRDLQVCVQVVPGQSGWIPQAPDAAVIAVQQPRRVTGIKCQSMVIPVRPVSCPLSNRGPARAAVLADHYAKSSPIDHVRVCGIDG